MKNICISLLAMLLTLMPSSISANPDFIGKKDISHMTKDLMTPEVLWSMGRINSIKLNNDLQNGILGVSYYSVEKNKSHRVLYKLNPQNGETKLLTTSENSENTPTLIDNGTKVLFLSSASGSNQLWLMDINGENKKQISNLDFDIEDYLLSPDEKKIILVHQVDTYTSIEKKYSDLPAATGMVINDLNYKHWDQFVTTIPHPFLAEFSLDGVKVLGDILEGEPYECPMLPFGGVENLCWNPNSNQIVYCCRKKVGIDYAISTDSDIFLYDLNTKKTTNLCKPANYKCPSIRYDESLQNQSVNKQKEDCNLGYDTNPTFSPNGKYIAWQSMERDGYESDRTRLCVYDLATGKKIYVTESFESGVDTYCWGSDSKSLYFTGVWHATAMVYSTNFKGEVKKLTDGIWDYSVVATTDNGKKLIVSRHSMSQADEIYLLNLKNNEIQQITFENKHIYDQLTFGKVEKRWITTTDGQKELTWIIYPPFFDKSKKYPTLLFCEGGPQSPVSQFWSYRWNMQIMAASGYIIVAPNRRGLPGFGMKWLEDISGNYTGQCMEDYLSAIDELKKEPFVDENRLGCVGASFGGYSVYWLAGHHNKRFKAFIAHDGIFNTTQQYTETEEMWFPNWDFGCAPWKNRNDKAWIDSPHLSIDKWDTPILCIHGMKDYRILSSQGESAFNAARMRGVPAQLLLLPDENHWVLKPQNGVLWQRTFFKWLDKWLKK